MIEAVHTAPTAATRHVRESDATTMAVELPAATNALPPLASISQNLWKALGAEAIEPNGYCLAEWESSVNDHSRGRMNVEALAAYADSGQRLIGLMPAISAWRAYKLPLPAIVSADSYPPLGPLLLSRRDAHHAVQQMMDRARVAGARTIIMRDVPLDGENFSAIARTLEQQHLAPRILHSHARALLDATRNADDLLRDALGAKKLKELRRQRNRLADTGEVIYTIASTPDEASAALEVFLKLEASGWKARRGTALIQDDNHLAFIRRAVRDMAASGHCQIVSLYAGETAVASAIVLRHLGRAFYFKMGVDEAFAKYSPGVQLTLELTRQMCADPEITSVDSTAAPDHPMIDPIWRERLRIGDVLIPLHQRDTFIPFIQTALALRRAALVLPRRAVRLIRKFKEKLT